MKLYYSFNHNIESQEVWAKSRYLYRILPDFLAEHGITTSIKEMEVTFCTPNPKSTTPEQDDYLNKLPYIRFTKNRTHVSITKRFLGKHGDEQPTIDNILFEFIEIFQLLENKKKADDDFQTEKILALLSQLAQELNRDLDFYNQKTAQIIRQEQIDMAIQDRQVRSEHREPAKRLIRDIRLMYHFNHAKINHIGYFLPYDNQLCDKILSKLREKKFRLPNYDHLYIMVSDSVDDALSHAFRAARWFVYGVAVLEHPEQYQHLSPKEQKKLIFHLIKQGLLDIARVDHLDMTILNEVLDNIEQSIQ